MSVIPEDLVARLRLKQHAKFQGSSDGLIEGEAADEIERLRLILLGCFSTATALYRENGDVLAYQVWPKDMEKLLAEVRA